MKILITGAAGFIGYNFCDYLLNKTSYKIYGIDNFDNYYNVQIKKDRLKNLKKYKNFKFKKVDIRNNLALQFIFKKNKFDFVFNLAAQAGVRYSIKNPRKYIDSNITGFFNIIENSKKYNVKRLFYASSSSVYGENKIFPLNESETINPKNIYGLSKKINEEISSIFNKYYKLNVTGLRFFTVYGEWGRPDMMMMKFIDCHFKKKTFELYNYGNHFRDFTYIGDVTKIMFKLLKKNKKLKSNDVLNICSNKPISLKNIIDIMKTNNIKPKINKVSLQQADIIKTHGNNKKLINLIGKLNFNSISQSISKTILWYKKYYMKK